MTLPLSNTTGLLERLAAFTEKRHEVLTANVAHASTPEYERRDLDVEGFRAAMKRAVRARREGASPASRYLPPSPTFDAEMLRPRTDAERNVRFHDGGVRSIETEMMELTKNSMQHSFALEVLRAQFDMLQTVISERP